MTIEITGGLPAKLVQDIYRGLNTLEHADEIIAAQVDAKGW